MSESKKFKVYTKTGDQGKTSLLGGERVFKHNLRISLYGEMDELNSHLGYLVTLLDQSTFDTLIEDLKSIQHRIFDLGSYFACENKDVATKFQITGISNADIVFLEKKIDEMDNSLMPLKNFILPGGDRASAYAHVCRTVCRRVERILTQFYNEAKIILDTQMEQLIYINRLSDYFFITSRWINHKVGAKEVLWLKF